MNIQMQLGTVSVMSETYSISLITTLRNIQSDLLRYRITLNRSYPAIFVVHPGLLASIYYRLGHWLWYTQGFHKILTYIIRPFYLLGKRFIEAYAGISISPHARIGRGFFIEDFGSIYIGPSRIGDNCSLSHEVSVGLIGPVNPQDLPVLGDRVFIGAGAKIVEPVSVGDDVAVGAMAVVTTDLPDCAVAVGVPARAVSFKGSFEFIVYDGMETDPERLQNLNERDHLPA